MSTRAPWTGIALLLAFGACGGGGPGVPDTVAPVAHILFPPAPALATTATLTVSGTAADDRRVVAVTVNGVAATSGNGFATWRAQVPLAPGVTTLSVEARDAAGNTAAAAVDVTRVAAVFAAPGGIAFDAARGQAFLVDRAQGALLAVDVATGALEVVTLALEAPQGLVLDAAGDRALVVDSGLQALVAVDLDTGAVSVLSDAATGTGPALASPRAVDFDPAAGRAWIVDNVLRHLVRVDLATGDRLVVAAGLANPQGVRLDPDGTGALVADGARLARVDLATGDVAEVAGSGPAFGNATGLDVDAPNRRAFVVDALLAAVVGVDLDTGARTVVADTDLSFPAAIAYDAAGDRALVADTVRDAVLAVAVATGAVTPVVESSFGAGPALASPRDLALDGDQALVADFGAGLVAVATDRAVLDGGGPPFQVPLGVAVDAAGACALVADSAAGALFEVDLATGARTVVNDALAAPTAVAYDAAQDCALVLDGAAFVAVDLASGTSAPLPAGSGPGLLVPRGFVFDATAGRILVVDDGRDALLSVDIATGARAELADGFAAPVDVAADPAGGRAFVVDGDAVLVVALAGGATTPLAGAGPPLIAPVAVAYDGRLLVVDDGLSALLAVEPETGERVILSK